MLKKVTPMKGIRIFSLAYVIFLYQIIISCEKEPFVNTQPQAPQFKSFNNVDERLWSYFEDFEKEAEDRGLNYDLNRYNLIGSIDNIPQTGVAGTCSYGSRFPRHVTIDLPFWQNAGFYSREMVVFHELGHCILNRGHSEDRTANGYCASIMRSGTGSCRTLYNSQNRNYYLDELFETLRP